jgi:hypothetical protein
MEPTFRRGDHLIVAPCDRYLGEGVYIVDVGDHPCTYRVQSAGGGVLQVFGDNPAYWRDGVRGSKWTRADFDAAVLGKAIGHVAVLDYFMFREAMSR